MSTNLYHSAALLDDTLTTAKCWFSGGGIYTFLVQKTLATSLIEGDILVVQKSNGSYATVKLAEIDEESDIDLDAAFDRYSFIIGKVDSDLALELNTKLEQTVATFKKHQRVSLRNRVKNELMIEFSDASDAKGN